jgi:medium-chain acyl-[acyl-carrier-protein] hydrolase
MRLFCFPYAGAGASVYQPWKTMLPQGVELCAIQMPGREVRISERPITEWPSLIRQLESAILPWLDCPFAFFGHSLGALVAFELAGALRRRGHAEPLHLFVSGRAAPHLVGQEPIHALPEPEFVQAVARMNGTPQEVLQSKELMSLLIPLLRADFTLSETYRHQGDPSLTTSMSAYGGRDDLDAPPDKVAAWRQHTHGAFRHVTLPGGHFFVNQSRTELLAEVNGELHQALRGLPGQY